MKNTFGPVYRFGARQIFEIQDYFIISSEKLNLPAWTGVLTGRNLQSARKTTDLLGP